ncbi:MAG: HAMP domain-containing protein, partial [Verrucomicrobia bacterium]|nr:HAMP domain-containing protein [Verrucomicrobiota bacterium]
MQRQFLLGILPILCLFAAIGVYAITLFKELGGKIDVILKENYRSVLAGEAMKEGLARMDSAVVFSLVGENANRDQVFAQGEALFADGLRREMDNVTLPGERELAERTRDLHGRYLNEARRFFATPDTAQRNGIYFGSLLPLTNQIRDTVQEIIRINQDNMVDADRDARKKSSDSIRYTFLAVVTGIVVSLLLAWRLQAIILRPIRNLTAVTRELGEGNLDQVVPVPSNDELGELASAFNRLTSKLRAYRQVTTDEIFQARQLTEVAFSAFPDPILALSTDGTVTFANPAAGRFPAKVGVRPALPEEVRVELERVLKGGPDYLPKSFESAIPLQVNDQATFFLPRIVGMRDEAGHVFGAALVLQDVTRFRLLDEVKTNLVSTVSHELKTPLTSVRMGLHLLLEERIGPLTPKQLELVLAAREDSERLLRMINDLLDLTKLESGGARRHAEPIDAQTLVDMVLEDEAPLVRARGQRLVAKVAPGVPALAVDAGQIRHVFSNLISNAVKHSRPGDVITLKAEPVDHRVRFAVIDQGPGVPEPYQERIFERFFRVPGGEQNGVGLGLAIAKEIVTAHGGRIGVRNVPGQGAEFF